MVLMVMVVVEGVVVVVVVVVVAVVLLLMVELAVLVLTTTTITNTTTTATTSITTISITTSNTSITTKKNSKKCLQTKVIILRHQIVNLSLLKTNGKRAGLMKKVFHSFYWFQDQNSICFVIRGQTLHTKKARGTKQFTKVLHPP